MQRVLLVDGHVLRSAVDLAGGGMHHPPHAVVARCHQHVERSQDVGVHHLARMDIRIGNGDQRTQVKDRVNALHGVAHRLDITQVAGDHLHPRQCLCRQQVEQAQISARRVTHKRAHLRAFARQPFHQMAADEATSTCYQHRAARPIHALTPCL